MASILNVFEPKTKIKSSEVNENFELVQKDVSEMGQALNTYVEGEIASVQSTVGSVQATLQENINSLTKSKLNVVEENLETSGFCELSNGLTLMWGRSGAVSGEGLKTVNLPRAFKTTNYIVIPVPFNTTTNIDRHAITIQNQSTSYFKFCIWRIEGGASGNRSVQYIAIGR